MHDSVLALLSPSQPSGEPSGTLAGPSQPLEQRVVASISAEIAAALAQAQARIYDEDGEDDEDGSDAELLYPDSIVPQTSGIRGENAPFSREDSKTEVQISLPLQVDDADDEFPIQLRTRKEKEPVGVVGLKRKRS